MQNRIENRIELSKLKSQKLALAVHPCLEPAGRVSEQARSALEPAGRAMELAERAWGIFTCTTIGPLEGRGSSECLLKFATSFTYL